MANLNWESQHKLFPALLSLGFLICAALLGIVIAQENLLFLIIFVAALSAAVIIKVPTLLLWIVLIGGLVFSGLTELYLPQFKFIRWAVVVGALTLLVIAVFRLLTNPSVRPTEQKIISASPLIWLGLFGVVSIFSALYNRGLSFDTVIGLKGYFQVWGVAYAMAWFGLNRLQANRILIGLLWLAILQIPFALHQYLFLVPLRMSQEDAYKGMVALDIVVGTFIGNMKGGGGNVILATLQVISIGIILLLWRIGKISGIKTSCLSLIYFIPIALNEAKAVVLFIPIILASIFQDTLLKRPFQTLVGTVLVFTVLVGLLVIYSFLPRAAGQRNINVYDFYEDTVAYNFGDKGYGNQLLNRKTVYSFWANHHGLDNLPTMLIGHGPGITNEDTGLMRFSLARDVYPKMGIGLTGISALLWEVGILGTLLMGAVFLSAISKASKLATQYLMNTHQYAYLKGVQAGLLVIGANLLHNNYLVFELGFQTLMMVLFGYIFHVERTQEIYD